MGCHTSAIMFVPPDGSSSGALHAAMGPGHCLRMVLRAGGPSAGVRSSLRGKRCGPSCASRRMSMCAPEAVAGGCESEPGTACHHASCGATALHDHSCEAHSGTVVGCPSTADTAANSARGSHGKLSSRTLTHLSCGLRGVLRCDRNGWRSCSRSSLARWLGVGCALGGHVPLLGSCRNI